tara:strand:+ start:54 stop:296 length:243 start_codon:yes stop_codon:yes gene_type:complete
LKKILIIIFFILNCSKNDNRFFLSADNYEMWKDFIKPTEKELAWSQISWRSTFYDGLIDADNYKKPLLLWVMNGHPLGCT